MKELGFWDILDKHIENPPIPRLKPSRGFYPSESSIEYVTGEGDLVIEGECLRKLWYRKKKVKETNPTSLDAKWKMALGDCIHEAIVEKAKECRIYIGDEVEFYNVEEEISGRVDLFILHPRRNRIRGVEIKTISGYHQVRTVIDPAYGRKPRPVSEHVMQAGVYLDWFQTHQGVDEWCIVYIDREKGQRADFLLTLSKDREILVDGERSGIYPEKVYERFRKLKVFLKEDMLPERDYELQYSMPKLIQLANAGELGKQQVEQVRRGKMVEKGDWQCSYCAYKDLCWNLQETPTTLVQGVAS